MIIPKERDRKSDSDIEQIYKNLNGLMPTREREEKKKGIASNDDRHVYEKSQEGSLSLCLSVYFNIEERKSKYENEISSSNHQLFLILLLFVQSRILSTKLAFRFLLVVLLSLLSNFLGEQSKMNDERTYMQSTGKKKKSQ